MVGKITDTKDLFIRLSHTHILKKKQPLMEPTGNLQNPKTNPYRVLNENDNAEKKRPKVNLGLLSKIKKRRLPRLIKNRLTLNCMKGWGVYKTYLHTLDSPVVFS